MELRVQSRTIYGRMFQQYKCDPSEWNLYGNIGDCIQNLAVKLLYDNLKITNPVLINHDTLTEYVGEKCILPMQGWFGICHKVYSADWADNIIPCFVGFHLNDKHNAREVFIKQNIAEKMKKFEPIGCRDRNTAEFLASLGLNTYFSGCLTLTFPKREKEPDNGKIFIVDLYQKAYEMLPDFILEQADCSITHKYKFKKYPISYDEAMEFESKAQEILDRYKNEAKLVITSRIHCAMPCIAMGIPVIYIHRGNHKEDTRLDVIKGLIPAYTPEQVDIINWNPKALNIEPFKKAIAGNAALHICNAAHDYHERKNSIKLLTKFAKCFENKALFDDKVLNLKLKTTSKLKEIKLFKILYSKKKILIWGASIYIQNFIRKYKIHNNNIVGFIDSNTNKESHFINEYEVFTPEILEVYKPELIVFAIKNNHEKIYKKIKKFLEHNYPDINLYQDIM